MAAASQHAAYEQWFRAADKDKNGSLSSKEIKKALKAKGYKTSRKGLKAQFKQFDRDGDKKISLQEYLIAMGQVPDAYHKEAAIRKAFQKADRNGDGNLDVGEMNTIFREMHTFLNPDELFKICHQIDKDGSGKINYNEFLNFFVKQQGMNLDSSDDEWD